MLLNRRAQLAVGLALALLALLALVSSRSRLADVVLPRSPAAPTVLPATSYRPDVDRWDEWQSPNATASPQRSDIRAAVRLAPFRRSLTTQFVILARNSDLGGILSSMRQIEDRFNRRYHYPFVFINNEEFSEHFIKQTSGVASGEVRYGRTPDGDWGAPEWIDEKRAANARMEMGKAGVLYGDSASYRAMCRYFSGPIYRSPLLADFDYYWRLDPDVKFFCDGPWALAPPR